MIHEHFPQEYIDLDKELCTDYHPDLNFIQNYSMDDLDMKLAQIAAYCEVMMDGDYNLNDRIKLCGILVEKLKEKRKYPDAQKIILLHN